MHDPNTPRVRSKSAGKMFLWAGLLVAVWLSGCRSLPADLLTVATVDNQGHSLGPEKMGEITREVRRICMQHGLIDPNPSEPKSDRQTGILFFYLRPEAEAREPFVSIIVERDEAHLTVQIGTDGTVPEPAMIQELRDELLASLRRIAGEKNVAYERVYNSGLLH